MTNRSTSESGRLRAVLCAALLSLLAAPAAHAQISVNPNGVNVRNLGVTSVFLTFRGLAPGQVPQEGLWCGAIAADNSCVPGTIFGRLPARSDLSTLSGGNNFTDIMTIPASVARRAYQDAKRGNNAQFFYVRRFSGVGPDVFVAVTCRPGAGGARTPLSLTDVKVRFDVEKPVLFVARGTQPGPVSAEIRYNGSGRLRGRWEVVMPGDPQPDTFDLLTEASLPAERRGAQRRYTLAQRFDVFLPPTGFVKLPGPDPARLPTGMDGLHLLLLRIEATDETEARSDATGAIVRSGAVAGFPMPPLRYYVGSGDDEAVIASAGSGQELTLLAPLQGTTVPTDRALSFSWLPDPGAVLYRLELRRDDEPVYAALVDSGVSSYSAPPWLGARVGAGSVEWRVMAYGQEGAGVPSLRSEWRELRLQEAE